MAVLSIKERLITLADNLQSRLNDINAALTEKGQSEAISLNEVAGKIEAISTTSASSVEQATPTITVSSSGLITASATQASGLVSAGTKSATKQLSVQATTTITPTTSRQLAVLSGRYTTGSIYVEGDANLKAENIKSGISIFGVSGTHDGGSISPVGEASTGEYYMATPSSIRSISFDMADITDKIAGFFIIPASLSTTSTNQYNITSIVKMEQFSYDGSIELTSWKYGTLSSVGEDDGSIFSYSQKGGTLTINLASTTQCRFNASSKYMLFPIRSDVCYSSMSDGTYETQPDKGETI